MTKEMKREIKLWDEINDISQGIYTIPSRENNLRMREVRKYCKVNNKKYSELTDVEWENFTIRAGVLVCAE